MLITAVEWWPVLLHQRIYCKLRKSSIYVRLSSLNHTIQSTLIDLLSKLGKPILSLIQYLLSIMNKIIIKYNENFITKCNLLCKNLMYYTKCKKTLFKDFYNFWLTIDYKYLHSCILATNSYNLLNIKICFYKKNYSGIFAQLLWMLYIYSLQYDHFVTHNKVDTLGNTMWSWNNE